MDSTGQASLSRHISSRRKTGRQKLPSSRLHKQGIIYLDISVRQILESIHFRPPGIYKADYIEELVTRYGGDLSDAPAVPDMPAWCFEEEQSDDTGRVDDDGHAIVNDDEDASVGAAPSGGGEGTPGKSRRGKTSKFMEGNVEMVQQQ